MQKFSPETLKSASYEEGIIIFLSSGYKTSLGKDVQEFFQSWQAMTSERQRALNNCMEERLNESGVSLYKSMIRGFGIWNEAQEKIGAPGWCVSDSTIHHLSKQMETKLMSLFQSMDLIWFTYHKKSPLNDPFLRKEKAQQSSVTGADSKIQDNPQSFPVKLDGVKVAKDLSDSQKIISRMCLQKRKLAMRNLLAESTLLSSKVDKDASKFLPDSGNKDKNERTGSFSRSNFSADQEEDLLEADHLLRNLCLDDCSVDPDFEKQISPIISDVEEQI
ncbi:uncharacterized protein [Parasteatoda tepidariorum]|uniref:uncharacterized protein n=1 Tax=Parasteatoda tepidariorum TaxID=114398 RepID=UPI001C717E40|nr:uncharacterized protein LOC107437453 [Parasteatoda tepidariorum]